MALPAEALQSNRRIDPTNAWRRADFHVVQDQTVEPTDENSPPRLIDSDSIPELQFARRRAGQEAARVSIHNMRLFDEGRSESVPRPIDVLGTGQRVVAAKRIYGEGSPDYIELFEGLLLDCERLFGEGARKLTYEKFRKTRQNRDSVTGDYFMNSMSLTGIVFNGLSPSLNAEEKKIRMFNVVEEGTYKAVGNIGTARVVELSLLTNGQSERSVAAESSPPKLAIVTVLPCAEWAHESLERDKNGLHGGYVPEMDKMMLRRVHFDGSGDRFEEQFALPGIYITPEVIAAVMTDMGAIKQGEELNRADWHGKQFIDLSGNELIDIVQALDEKASEVTGKIIFMGEEVDADHPRNYAVIEAEAEERRQKLIPMPQQLADYIVELTENETPAEDADRLVNYFLNDKLLAVAKKNPARAEIIFGKATADGFREVARLEAQGKFEEAQTLEAKVVKEAPPVPYCGAGSCGLERINQGGADAQKARELGLSGEIIHDKERACPSCSAFKVHYDERGNKACTACGNCEIKH